MIYVEIGHLIGVRGEVCTSDEFAILYQREFHYVWWRALHDNSFLCLCEYFWKILIWKC